MYGPCFSNFNTHREWTDDGQLWVQYVSSTPATRLDVTNLQEQLDQKLQQRQARETGICPVREELYSQCFGKLALDTAVAWDTSTCSPFETALPVKYLLFRMLRMSCGP